MKPVVVDTSIWVQWLRGESSEIQELARGRMILLPKVVEMELFAIAPDQDSQNTIEKIVQPFAYSGRIIDATHDELRQTGRILSHLQLPRQTYTHQVIAALIALRLDAELWSLSMGGYGPICDYLGVKLGLQF